MRPTDHHNPLSEFIAEFLDGCGMERPFYLVSISKDGSVNVTHWSDVGEKRDICERVNELMVLPIVLTVISLDGRGASTRIVADDDGVRLMQ
jgi:hypothetical protein